MKDIENRICCLNCQFFSNDYEKSENTDIRKEIIKIYNDKAFRGYIENKINFEHSGSNFDNWKLLNSLSNNTNCYKGIWDNIEKHNFLKLLFKQRLLNECFFIKHNDYRSLEASEQLQEREYKRRESQKQWFITILALFATVLTAIAGIIFSSFLKETNIFWKSMVLLAFVVFGYSIFNLLKVRFWDNRI